MGEASTVTNEHGSLMVLKEVFQAVLRASFLKMVSVIHLCLYTALRIHHPTHFLIKYQKPPCVRTFLWYRMLVNEHIDMADVRKIIAQLHSGPNDSRSSQHIMKPDRHRRDPLAEHGCGCDPC